MERVYNDYLEQKIKKGELILTLREFKGIFSKSLYNYLYALINNEFSVVRNYISEEDRRLLSNLELFYKISMYNITKRALNIFKNFDSEQVSELEITSYSRKEVPRVTAKIGSSKVTLFGTNSSCINIESPYSFIPFSDKNEVFSPIEIPLYKSIMDPEKVYSEIEKIQEKIKHLYNRKNPFNPEYIPKVKTRKPHVGSGGYAEQWRFEKQLKFDLLNSQIKELTKLVEKSSQEENRVIADITSQVISLFLDDYGLKEEDINQIQRNKSEEETEIHKRYVRKMPGLIIEKNITYI